ncbi:unnamed protein product [Brassica oleracea]
MVAPTREGLVTASTVGRRSMISSANFVEPMKLQRERRHRAEDGGDSSTSQADSKKRPPGVKASKASGKQTVDQEKQVKEFERIWTIKQKDFDAKERLTKMSLLDSLIGKKEPLADFSFLVLFVVLFNQVLSSITGVATWTRTGESGKADKTTRALYHGTCTLALF